MESHEPSITGATTATRHGIQARSQALPRDPAGMTAETFSRTLQTLADHGLAVEGTTIIVRNPERAAAFFVSAPLPWPTPPTSRRRRAAASPSGA